MDLKLTVHKLLNSLSGRMYSQVISKLREILITGQVPSYEVRKNEIESIFLNSINRYSNSVATGRLENLIYSNTEMFDIIFDFFYHKMDDFRKCALEVYIRRAYMAYEIHSFKQSKLSSGQLYVIFQFSRLNISVSQKKRSNSIITLNYSSKNHCSMRKYSQFLTIGKVTSFYLEKEDISETFIAEHLNEYNSVDNKHNDNDTDSAISIGEHSLSDQVEFDSINDSFLVLCQPSSSIQSLEEIPTANKTNMSFDSLVPHRNRNASIYFNQPSFNQYEDFIGNPDIGIMMIFDTIEEFDRSINGLTELLQQSDPLDYIGCDHLDHKINFSIFSEIVLNVALCDADITVKSDDDISKILHNFCFKYSTYLCEIKVSRITFLLQSMDKSLRYFTFGRPNFEEDLKMRQTDPALSFQLEINRLQNYHLERLSVINRRMYVYLGRYKQTLTTAAEYRMFVRCITHHNDINSSTTNIDFMAKEAEKSFVEAMDALDIAHNDARTNLTSSNHLFFYFNLILCITKMEVLESVVRTIVLKYCNRLWSLRITQAELKLSVKLKNDSISVIPIRLWVHNEREKSLDIFIYKEEFQSNMGQKCLISWSSAKEGCYHGVPVDCFYSI